MTSEVKPWKVLASKYLLRDRWLTVRADTCVTARGTTVDPYYVLEYGDWCNVIAFDEQMRVLMIEQYRHSFGKVIYELPGGMVDEPNEPVVNVARRELLEETGCSAERIESLGSYCPNAATQTNLAHFFIAYGCKPTQAPDLDAAEDIITHFLTIPEVFEAIRDGRFQQAYHIATFYMGLEHAGLLSMK